MAEKKKFGSKESKQIDVRPSALPSGVTDSTDTIKEMFELFKDSISSATAAFMVGKAGDGKTDKILQSKVQSQKKSILGDKDSIYYLLENILNELRQSNKTTIQSIDTLEHIDKINSSIRNLLGDIYYEKLSEIILAINTIEDNIKSIKFPDIDINEISSDYISGIALIEKNVENLKSYYENTTDKLFDLNKEIRENNEKQIAEANLNIAIKGLDDFTVQAFKEFAEINLNKLDANAKSIITFFNSLQILENIDVTEYIKKIENVISLTTILKSINNIELPKDNKLNDINEFINNFNIVISAFENLSKKKLNTNKIKDDISKYLKTLEEIYKEYNKLIEQIIATGNLADNVKIANDKIANVLDNCAETAVKSSQNAKNIKQAQLSMQSMTSFMIVAAGVMAIGALFVMAGGGKFIKAAFQFALSLAIFEAMVISPALMFMTNANKTIPAMNNFNGFIVTCALTMLVGALFITLGGGKFVKNALVFAILLGVFETLVVAPVLLFSNVKDDIIKSINEFSKFIITCTIIMAIGALFMNIGNGKFIRKSLEFGITLAIFEGLVVLPFVLFGKIKATIFENAKSFAAFIITSTIILLVGALFMSIKDGALVKGSYRFALALMKFEAMIIAPFLIFNLVKKDVFNGLKAFTTTVIVCTTILLIGALFMTLGGGKFVKNALQFTALLMAFEALIIAPFIIFNAIDKTIMGGLKSFGIVVFVATTVLIVGALFMTMNGGKMWLNALAFTGILALFEAAIVAPMLLFNIIKKDALAGVRDFGLFVFLSSTALLTGAFFIANYGSQSVFEYAMILGSFVVAMTGIATILSKFGKYAIYDMAEFGLFVFLSSAALLIGALFVEKHNMLSIITYGIILGVFVASMSIVAGALTNIMGPQTLTQMLMFGTFILLSSAALVIGAAFVQKYGVSSALQFAALLFGFIIFTSLIFLALTAASPYIAPGIIIGTLLGVAIMTLSGSIFILNAIFEKDPNGAKTINNLKVLAAIIMACALPFTLLLALNTPIVLGSLVAIAMSGAIALLGTAFGLINLMIGEHGEQLKTNITIINELLGFDYLAGTFALLAILNKPIVLGSLVAIVMSCSLTLLGSALSLINAMIGEHGEQLKANILILNELLGFDYLGGTFSLLGLLSLPIYLGSIVGVAMAGSITILGGALSLVNLFIDPIKDTIIPNLEKMQEAILQIGVISGELKSMTISLALSMPALGLLNMFCLGITTSTLMISKSINTMSEIGDISQKMDLIISNLQSFVDIPDKVDFDGIDGIFKKLGAIAAIRGLVIPMGETMNLIAESVTNIASMKVAKKWDKEGHAIDFRNLEQKDFDLAIDNTGKLITTMAFAFKQAWFGDGENEGLQKFAEDKRGGLWATLYFSKQIGQVIKGIAEGVGAMAQMQIPIQWDNNGNPIAFRQLKQKDFDLASTGVSTILTSMVKAIIDVYGLGNGLGKQYGDGTTNIFDSIPGILSDKPSPFLNTLSSTMKIGELIANIGEGVGKMASMQIPIEWDPKTGKAKNFRTLKPKDFNDASANVKTILSELITCIANLYADGNPNGNLNKGIDDNNNIFDSISGGLFSSDKPSHFMTVLESSFKLSELIANISTGIKDIAILQIPDEWNNEGIATHYTKLSTQDFTDAGTNIGTIITTISEAVGKINIDPDTTKTIGESLQPIVEFISGASESVLRLATGQIATKWDPKTGTPIEFVKLEKEDYDKAANTIAYVIGAVGSAITQFGTDNSDYFTENGKYKGKFGDIVESISGISKIVSDIADSVVKLGQGLVADRWDPKTGTPIHYKPIDFTKAAEDAAYVVRLITTTLAQSIIDLYKGNETIFDISNDNSPFAVAVNGITGVTKIVSNIIDSIVKLGSAQIPNQWDKDGKAIHYKTIDVNNTVKNIKDIFEGNDNDGLLNILCTVIKNTADKYFSNDTNNKDKINISNAVDIVSDNIEIITKTIAKAADAIVNIASLHFPTKWDNEGNATAFKSLQINDIENAKTNIINILSNLFGVITTPELSNYTNKANTTNAISYAEQCETLSNNITNIYDVINTAISNFDNIIQLQSSINNLYKYQANTKDTNLPELLTIDLFKDIYSIINNYGQLANSIFTSEIFANSNTLNNENFVQLNNNINNISSIVMTIFENASELSIKSIVFKENLKDEIISSLNNIKDVYSSIISILNNFNNVFNDKSTLDNNKLITLTINLSTVTMTITSLFSGMGDIYKEFYNNVTSFKTSINEIINQMDLSETGFDKSILNLKKNMNILSEIYNTEIKYSDELTKRTIFKDITDDLQDFINNGINPFDNKIFNKFNNLNTSVNTIYNSINNQKENTAFDHNTERLQKYINTINSVNVAKLRPLTELVVELNRLAVRLGNLDGLTDAIANNLSTVLQTLVDALNESKNTIDKAETIQSKRQKAINESIATIQTLMNQPLNVTVKAAEQTVDVTNGTGDSGSNSSSNITINNNGNGSGETLERRTGKQNPTPDPHQTLSRTSQIPQTPQTN